MKYKNLIKEAWESYDNSRTVKNVKDISIRVSTNHVYNVYLNDFTNIIAKISDYGYVNNFVEDHTIINSLSINLPYPFENFLAKSLTKNGKLFIYKKLINNSPIWIIFYNPIRTFKKPLKIQRKNNIKILGEELAHFHTACKNILNVLPKKSKTFNDDIRFIMKNIENESFSSLNKKQKKIVLEHCNIFLTNTKKLLTPMNSLPVFIDWNIGNFSVDRKYHFFSRWDYDWFRIGHRVMDFYFFSKVCSKEGDSSIFTYSPNTIMEKRFMDFLKSYHQKFALSINDINLMPEMYRFFLLNYVIKDGHRFFNKSIAKKLITDSVDHYLKNIKEVINTEYISGIILK